MFRDGRDLRASLIRLPCLTERKLRLRERTCLLKITQGPAYNSGLLIPFLLLFPHTMLPGLEEHVNPHSGPAPSSIQPTKLPVTGTW